MEWIMEMIYPVIRDCETPEQAREAIIEWGTKQHPRDAACGLIMVDWLNKKYYNETPELLT